MWHQEVILHSSEYRKNTMRMHKPQKRPEMNIVINALND